MEKIYGKTKDGKEFHLKWSKGGLFVLKHRIEKDPESQISIFFGQEMACIRAKNIDVDSLQTVD